MSKVSEKFMSMGKPKRIVIICVSVLLILGILGGALYLFIPVNMKIDMQSINKIQNNVILLKATEESGQQALAKVDDEGNITDEPFKIVSFTDTHLDTYRKKTEVTMDMIIKNINREKPDLVVFVGDIITSSNNSIRRKQLCEVMEKFGVYWATVLGNHEGEGFLTLSREKQVEKFASYPHCLVESDTKKTSDGTIVWGNGNYTVNILKADGKVRQSLVFIDSGDMISKADAKKYNTSKDSYDYIKPSQIKWYEEKMDELEEGVKSMAFLHIPLPEYKTALEKSKENDEQAVLEYGEANEGICCSEYNSGFFDAVLKKQNTQAIVCGHDHINDFRIKYKGVYLIYNQPSGYSSYNLVTKGKSDKLLKGCSIYTIKADGEIEFDAVKNMDLYDHTEIIKKLYK